MPSVQQNHGRRFTENLKRGWCGTFTFLGKTRLSGGCDGEILPCVIESMCTEELYKKKQSGRCFYSRGQFQGRWSGWHWWAHSCGKNGQHQIFYPRSRASSLIPGCRTLLALKWPEIWYWLVGIISERKRERQFPETSPAWPKRSNQTEACCQVLAEFHFPCHSRRVELRMWKEVFAHFETPNDGKVHRRHARQFICLVESAAIGNPDSE